MTSATRTQRSCWPAGENIKVVNERLGHASVVVTLSVYSHVMPGNQRETAGRLAAMIEEAA